MKTIIDNLEFNGALIQFTQSDDFDTMINATEMGKLFGPNKRPYQWLRQKDTQDYLQAFEKYQESTARETRITPVITIEGHYSNGTRPGTWMHRWVAIRYAQWLDPRFAIWVDSKIDELLRIGFTTALKEERDRYNSLLPQVNYYNEVLAYSENLYSTEQLCKDLGLGYGTKILLKKLEEKKYIYRRPGIKGWYLSSPYDKEGYTKVTSAVVTDKHGNKHIKDQKKWTESGKHWIWSLSKKL
jgi:phage antirepressor YoqD-like protein